MKKQWYILVVLVLSSVAAFAQPRLTLIAMAHCNNGQLDSAQLYIDEAITLEEGASDAQSWTYRGYIYKAIYKANERSDPNSPARITSIDSYKKSIALLNEGLSQEQSLQGITYLSKTYYNDAVRALNAKNPEQAIKNYAEFKEIKAYIEPAHNFKEEDIRFYNIIASSVYTVIYDADREEKAVFFDKAIEAYKSVLQLDSNDYNANYNTGVLYYNKGVNNIKGLDPEAPIPIIVGTQDECVVLFKKALPYMLKAYNLNPKRREVLIGLSGIYFSLNEINKSNHYNKLLEEVDKSKGTDDQD
jgi:tetratricopeptide (TPR) repeat protein